MAMNGDFVDGEYWATHMVGERQHGRRLDRFLKNAYRKRSREELKRAIDRGVIYLKRQSPHLSAGVLKPSTVLHDGDRVLVRSVKKNEPPVDFNYKILYEDEYLLVVDKPGNLPVHPAGKYFYHTLFVHLKMSEAKKMSQTLYSQEGKKMVCISSEREFFLVHRIDKETSGVLLISKNKEMSSKMIDSFSKRKIKKTYLAIIHGTPEKNEFQNQFKIGKATHSKIHLKMKTYSDFEEGGSESITDFKVLKNLGKYTLLECSPKTGRQHQIRVHLESLGHPIVGDKLYSIPESESLIYFDGSTLTPEAEAKLVLPRQALHAKEIEFLHPITSERMHFKSEIPSDLQSFIDQHSI